MDFVLNFVVMLMPLKLSPTVRTARANAIKAAIDGGAGNGKVFFYEDTIPTPTGAEITTQKLLAVCDLESPCGVVSDGVMTFSGLAVDLSAYDTGTIGFGRITDWGGAFIADGDAGLANSNAMFKFNKLEVLAGGKVSLLSITIVEGNA
jgi:hypothetical protein